MPSHVSAWLAGYKFGVASYNLHLEFLRAAFALAVADRLVSDSPVAGVKTKKRATPTWDEFQAIVADIRGQVFNADCRDSGDFVEFIGLAGGLGQAEAAALRWADIHWPAGRFTTFRAKTSRGFEVPIYPQLAPLLERMRQERGGSPPGPSKVFRLASAENAIAGACLQPPQLPADVHSPGPSSGVWTCRSSPLGRATATAASSSWTPTATCGRRTPTRWPN